MNHIISRLFFNRWAAFAHDLLCVPLAMVLAYWLRFNLGHIPAEFLPASWKLLLVNIPTQATLFWVFGFYRGFWRFASLPDLIRIVQSVLAGTVLGALIGVVLLRIGIVPRSVFFLYPLLLIVALSGPRMLYRYIKDRHLYLARRSGKRTLIVGAGRAGESLVRNILVADDYLPLGFLDDNPKRHGREILGVRVLGNLNQLKTMAARLKIETILLAIPSAGRDVIDRTVKDCSELSMECLTLPSLLELTGQPIETKHLRSITINDLLGREPVELDDAGIHDCLAGKKVLVTGGGGSIGSELCRQIAKYQPASLILFDHSEFNLYAIEMELQQSHPNLDLIAILGNVKDEHRITWAFSTFRPAVVFHAAAYKHVPMLEKNPAEGVLNNVIGTKIVADAADRFCVKRFVLLSTDKAVNPASVMGATKRIGELYCQNLAKHSKTRFITTRFGNVLGSAGSVVPLFEEQIKKGGPVTVTHKEISRYFMTIPEAVGLILQAGAMGTGGEIFVLEMGEPVLIRHLAEQMILLSGLRVGQDVQIKYTGLRPGEKLFEEVFHASESLIGTKHPKLQLAKARDVEWQWLLNELVALERAALSRDQQKITAHLQKIVPEYSGCSEPTPQKIQADSGPRLKLVSSN